ncbi:MAG: ferrochelatase [Dysgonamonadaceae bacterium]|jgi:ferrochelatase|nr:ferrochelatase [Dysgonamonadaceae bacterium]
MHPKTALLILNTGSPDSPNLIDVAVYLSKFLGDRRIISIPWFFRKILVHGIIVPSRCFKSAARYKKLSAMFGGYFPLLHYGEKTKAMLQEALGDKMTVFLGMCYGKPSIEEQIKTIAKERYSRLILLPLFPQYASSSSGAVLERALNAVKGYSMIPAIQIIPSFYDHPLFVKAFAEKIRQSGYELYEQIVFAYHSLPMSHIREVKGSVYDYENACRKTSELIARELDLPEPAYETTFQSQMSSAWLGPFINDVIVRKAKTGMKKLLVVAPSFVSDCLESSLELGEEAKNEFLSHGGEQYALVESLNDSPLWIDCLKNLVSTNKISNFASF